MKGEHMNLYRDNILGPARAVSQDPCRLGLPEMLTAAHKKGALLVQASQCPSHLPTDEKHPPNM